MTLPFADSDLSHVASDKRIVWLTNSLGYGDHLLYWGPILSRYVRFFPRARFLTAADGRKQIPDSEQFVERIPSIRVPLGKRRFSYDRHLRLVSPSIFRTVRGLQPKALVISEFTIPSLVATCIRRRHQVPTLLLVESDPLRGNPNRIGVLKRILRTHIARNVDWVLTNNDAGRRYVESHLKIAPSRVLCSPYVVSEMTTLETTGPIETKAETKRAKTRTELKADGRLVFLYVGQLVERKGLAQLINAVGRLTKSQRDQCQFWFIGEGEQRTSLEHLISQHGLAEQVKMLGRCEYKDLATYYQSADVFVMPTLDDYRALVGFEAIAYGLPLLHSCYDGAVGELVSEGRNGFVVDPQIESSLTQGIEKFIERRHDLVDFGEHSLKRSKKFTLQKAVESLVAATHCCLQIP